MSENVRLDNELTLRIGKASTAYGKLWHRLWDKHHVSIRVKCKVYLAIVLSSLLYVAGAWTIYKAQVLKCLHDEAS